MKNVVTLCLALAVGLFGSAALAKGNSGKNAGDTDVEVNHAPPTENFLLVIPVNALAGHLRHGDCLPGGIPQVEVEVPGPRGGTALEDDPAVLAAIDKASADLTYVDGCVGSEPPE